MNTRRKVIFVLLFLGSFLLSVSFLHASLLQNTIGWIWGGMDATGGGDTALGWISLNTRDCDLNNDGTVDAAELAIRPACPAGAAVDYGVNVPEVGDGPVTGYGWSEYYGWISFNANDVVGCPSGTCDARRESDKLAGWARILSIRDAGVNAGGWSGFIKLSSDGSDIIPYGVSISGKDLSGYAYSDELGWIDFSTAEIVSPIQLCVNGALFAVSGETKPLSIFLNASVDMRMYYDNTLGCEGTDVTADTSFVDTASPIVTITGSDPRTVAGTDVPGASAPGQQSADEQIIITYLGQTVTVNVTVIEVCISNCPVGESIHCSETTYTEKDSCEIDRTCDGKRFCDYNYKEAAP